MSEEHWYKEAIIYELHVKCFFDSSNDGIGDFDGLTQKLDYLQDLGVTAIWLLPFYPSPLKDDGYDIADYTQVHPHYGDLKDFKRFLREAHRRGLRVITELVVNHTSDQHPWFQRSRKAPKGSRERNFYVWNDTPEKYRDARIIFQDFETSNWTWDSVAKSYYWHRFYSHQPDLNYDNEEVRQSIFRILSYWLKMGVDGLRLDAIPYLYQREGTNCENLPETHTFLKKLRNYIDEHFEERMLLAEANQWPEDAAKYFGDGDECHMAFHFPVMPRLFMSIHLEDSLPIIEIMDQTPEIPKNCQWALFLRNHDELTLEMVTDEERDYMFRVYANDPQARVNLGIRRRLAPLLKNDRRKIELMNSLLFSLSGTPVLYYGDELGMGDNIYLGDRNSVRTPMQWSNDRNAGFSRANPQQLYLPPIIDPEYHFETVNVEAQMNNPYSLFWWTKQLIALRKRFKAFSYGTTEFLIAENRKVLIFFRSYQEELILIVANLSRFPQYIEIDLSKYNGYSMVEMFSGERFPKVGELPYFLTLGPYGYYWFSLEHLPAESRAELLERKRERQFMEMTVRRNGVRIFEPHLRRSLEAAIKRYLLRRIWFKSFLRVLERIRIVDHFILNKKIHIVVVEVLQSNAIVKRLLLFLTYLKGEEARKKIEDSPENVVLCFKHKKSDEIDILFDTSMDSKVASELAEFISAKKRMKTENGEIKGILMNNNKVPLKESIVAEGIRRDDAIIFSMATKTLRLFWILDEGMHFDIEMRLFLNTKTTFTNFLPLLGYIEYAGKNINALAIAEEIKSFPSEYNAMQLMINTADNFLVRLEARAEEFSEEILLPKKTFMELANIQIEESLLHIFEDNLENARLLGLTTAKFHQAMSSQNTDPHFSSISYTLFYQRSLYQTLRRKLMEAFGKLHKNQEQEQKKEIQTLLSFNEKLQKKLLVLTHVKIEAERIRCHGNYCLDNLHYTGKDFNIVNFDGKLNSSFNEKRFKRSPVFDLCTMLLSFAEASFKAMEKIENRGFTNKGILQNGAIAWSIWMGSAFLRSYFSGMKDEGFFPTQIKQLDFLIEAFLLEHCCEHIITGKIEIPTEMLLYWLPIYESDDDLK